MTRLGWGLTVEGGVGDGILSCTLSDKGADGRKNLHHTCQSWLNLPSDEGHVIREMPVEGENRMVEIIQTFVKLQKAL